MRGCRATEGGIRARQWRWQTNSESAPAQHTRGQRHHTGGAHSNIAPGWHSHTHRPTAPQSGTAHQTTNHMREQDKRQRPEERDEEGEAQRRRLRTLQTETKPRGAAVGQRHTGSTNGGDGGKQQANPHSSGREIDTCSDRHRGRHSRETRGKTTE
jgi:hypothetical protein